MPSPDAETADASLPPMTGAGEGLAASSPESLQPDPGADEVPSPAEVPPLADAAAPPTPEAPLTAGIGQPASPDDAADLPPAGAAPPAEPPPLSPAAAALDNARRGTWMMSEHFNGWVLLGADGKPVMRNDGSRVAFRFEDAARLADELSAAPDDADRTDNPRRALAPLDSGFNRDWDPQIPKSALADRTKLVKLLAYHYVQTTEPQEAVRRAVSDIFGDPVYIEQPGMKAWVPGKYDAEAVKSVASTLLTQVLGPAADEGGDGMEAMTGARALSTVRTIRDVPMEDHGLVPNVVKAAAISDELDPVGDTQVAQAGPPRARQAPAKGERRPPGQYKDGQITNIQPNPPNVQPGAVIQALKQNHLTQGWRDKLAEIETGGKPYDGYGTYLFKDKGFAYGRYQFRTGGLKDSGMMDMKTGDWTGKYGVNSWRDFLNNPQAQEAALKDWTQIIETRYMRKHLGQMGQTIKSDKGDITITPAGFIGACHHAGTKTMDEYFRWAAANNWDTRGKTMPDRDSKEIERRMQEFESIPHR